MNNFSRSSQLFAFLVGVFSVEYLLFCSEIAYGNRFGVRPEIVSFKKAYQRRERRNEGQSHLGEKKLSCPKFCSCSSFSITCQGKKLKKIPINKVDNLKEFTVQRSSIEIVTNRDLQKLFLLHKLDLGGNKIFHVEDHAFVDLINLKILDLSNNKLFKISIYIFRYLITLEELNLNKNYLVSIEGAVGFLANLHVLRLSRNKIQAISDKSFYGNSKVLILDLSWNHLEQIARDSFARMTSLSVLLLNNNPIAELEIDFKSNLHLEQLDLTGCKLKKIIENTPRYLKDFRLSTNKITAINDEDFLNSNAIQLLLLNDNEIKKISESAFDYMPLLHDLYINKNCLAELPQSMPDKLFSFYASHNRIRSISSRTFSKKYNLHYVVLSYNHISYIHPSAMKNLVYLEHLDLSHNIIKFLPVGLFSMMFSLEKLDISFNPLHTLEPGCFIGLDKLHILKMSSVEGGSHVDADVFVDLTRLQYLDVSNSSKLAKKLILPPACGRSINSVKNLNLINSGLSSLPYQIKENLQNLTVIKMTDNPWHCSKKNVWIKDWITKSSLEFYEPEKIICKTPLRLRGQRLMDLNISDLKKSTAMSVSDNQNEMQSILQKRWELINKTVGKGRLFEI